MFGRGRNDDFSTRFIRAIDTLNLGETDRVIIMERYLNIISGAQKDYSRNAVLFILLSNIVTIGGVLLSSLIAIQQICLFVNNNVANISMFWTTWILSVVVTISTKSLFSFDIAKKYLLNDITLEKLKSEGWQYVEGVNHYTTCKNIHERTKLFGARIESIKLKTLEMRIEADPEKNVDLKSYIAMGPKNISRGLGTIDHPSIDKQDIELTSVVIDDQKGDHKVAPQLDSHGDVPHQDNMVSPATESYNNPTNDIPQLAPQRKYRKKRLVAPDDEQIQDNIQ